MKKVVKTPIVTKHNDMTLSSPVTAHIELTYSCCFNCAHCYNYWRKSKSKTNAMSSNQLDEILNELARNGIMHVVFTGGEPLLNYDLLLKGMRKMNREGITVSCNSSLAINNSVEQLKVLRGAGLEHILTSLNSHIAEINDHLVSTKGAHKKIIQGIKNAVLAGIRISVNMIISKYNFSHIYQTARLAHNLGAGKFFGTRVVPNHSDAIEKQKEFWILEKEARHILDELLKVKNDFGLQVGTLVPFPLCFMGQESREKYAGFYSHGCPAGNKMIAINANGDVHACVHEIKNYGNIFETPIKDIWNNMKEWRTGAFFPDECKICAEFDECNGGCRMCAEAYKGDIASTDILRTGWGAIRKRQNAPDKQLGFKLDAVQCLVPQSIRFRKENNFYIVKRFGSEIICVTSDIAAILKKYQKRKKPFSPLAAGLEDIDTVEVLIKERLLVNAL